MIACWWGSMNPGRRVWWFRYMNSVVGPVKANTSSNFPTAWILSPLTARASAEGLFSSMVMIFPPKKKKSASLVICLELYPRQILTINASLWSSEVLRYSTANDPRPQMIPRPEMIPNRKWYPTLFRPQMIPSEKWYGICFSGRGFNFKHKQKQVITNHILYAVSKCPAVRNFPRISTVRFFQTSWWYLMFL